MKSEPLSSKECDHCSKIFQNSKSLASHKRWLVRSPEQRKQIAKKIGLKNKNNPSLHNPEHIARMREFTPKFHSPEVKAKISQSLIGNKRSLGKNVGEESVLWKGEGASYYTIHKWVAKWLGSPKKCEYCKLEDSNRMYHWANLSREYKRDLEDWIRLCVKCHSKYDRNLIKIGAKL